MKKLAIVSTHPIQYYAPVFRWLAQEVELKVFYTWGETALQKFDPGFGKNIVWDIPLLDGYEYTFLKNVAISPGSHHRQGIDNPTIIQQIEDFDPSVILVYGHAYKSHLKVIRHFYKRIPIWFRGDSTLLDKNYRLQKIIKTIYLKWIYSHIKKAFYVGKNNKAYFKKYGLKEEQLVFAPHSIDNERFAKDHSSEANQLRRSLKIGEEDVLILFAGKLEQKKNPMLLLEAFVRTQTTKQPNNQTTKTHLLFVGNGEQEASLKLKLESEKGNGKLNMENINTMSTTKNQNIHFLAFQNQTQMPVVYQACDLVCLPSINETWGLVVNEAMAAAKAILVSDQVGCAADLVDQTNGAIFKTNDIFELSYHLQQLTSDKQVLKKMGNASQKKINYYSFYVQIKAIIHEIEQL